MVIVAVPCLGQVAINSEYIIIHLWCYTCWTVCCRFYPVAVVLLVARLTLEMVDPVAALRLVSRFLLTVVVGEAAHFIVVLPLIYWAFTRRNPLTFFCSVSRALVMALASSDRSVLSQTYLVRSKTGQYHPRQVSILPDISVSSQTGGCPHRNKEFHL